MKRFCAGLGALLLCAAPASFSQGTASLVGTWTLVSVNDESPGGKGQPLYGPTPQGMLVFDAAGRYSLQLCAAGRPKIAANDRMKGTADEYKAAATQCNPHWGRYAMDPSGAFIVFKIDHALFANWEGTEQKRAFKLTGDTLRYEVPNPPVGGANPVVVWKRAP